MDPTTINTEVVVAALGMIEAFGVCVIGGIFGLIQHMQSKKRDKERGEDLAYRQKREERDKARQKRDKALYGVVLSTARGTQVLLHKAHGDRMNGDVEHSLSSIENSISEFNSISNEEMAKLG